MLVPEGTSNQAIEGFFAVVLGPTADPTPVSLLDRNCFCRNPLVYMCASDSFDICTRHVLLSTTLVLLTLLPWSFYD